MSRYTMDFEVTGNPVDALAKIEAGTSKIGKAAEGMRESMGKAGEALDTVASSSRAATLRDMADRFGESLGNIRGKGEEFVKEIIKDASTFEDAQSEMRFAFGKDWTNVYDQVLKDSADLTFTFEQTSRLASSLGRMKINPFGGTTEASQVFLSKTGESIRALSVLQDTADAVGKNADDVVVSLRNAMAGSWKSLEDRFDIPKQKIKEWRKEVDKLKEPQEKYNMLVSKLGEMFGGAGKEKALNYSKAMDQIPDLLQQIRAGAGQAGLKDITKGMFDLGGALADLVKNKDAMFALSEGFRVIAKGIEWGARGIASFVRWTTELLVVMPWLPKVVTLVGSIVVGFIALSSVFLTIATTAAAVSSGLAAVGVTGSGLLAGAATLLPVLLLVGGALTAIGLTAKAASGALTENWGGVGTTFEKISAVFKGLIELTSSYNGTTATMSTETADNLNKMGLMEFVLDAIGAFHKFQAGWEAFGDEIDNVSEKLGPTVIPMLEEMQDLFWELADALGFTDAAYKTTSGSTDDYAESGRDLADILIKITQGFITAVRWTTAFVRIGVQVLHLRESFMFVYAAVKMVVDMIKAAVGIADKFSKALGFDGVSKMFKSDSMRGDLFHKDGAAPAGAGDIFATKKRLAGGKYRDETGAFDPLKGDKEAQNLLGTGQSREEVLQWMLDTGRITKEDLTRRAKGRDSLPRAATGADYQDTYANMLGDTSKYDKADSPVTESYMAEGRKNIADQDAATKQAETNRLLGQVLEAIKADKSISIDGARIATSVQAHRAGERGNQ